MGNTAHLDEDTIYLENPQHKADFRVPPVSLRPYEFHSRLPDYQATRLARLDSIAAELGVERVWIKDESYRLGLPAFKVLGVSWALFRALSERLGEEPEGWRTLDDLRDAFEAAGPLTVIAATDGNHGRAVAHVARWFGAQARIYVPAQIPPGRAAAIRAEGADLEVVSGTYDEAVAAAVEASAADDVLLVSDVATRMDEVIPRWIVEGYSTMFREVDEQLAAFGEASPDLVIAQIGVGSLAAAVAEHYRAEGLEDPPRLVGIEPHSAACVLASARAGDMQSSPGPHTSIMDCLNAGAPSVTSLATLLASFDTFLAVGDERVGSSIEALARAGVVSGATGAAGLVGLYAGRDQLALTASTRILLINSEGIANPAGYVAALTEVAEAGADGQAPGA